MYWRARICANLTLRYGQILNGSGNLQQLQGSEGGSARMGSKLFDSAVGRPKGDGKWMMDDETKKNVVMVNIPLRYQDYKTTVLVLRRGSSSCLYSGIPDCA